MALFPKIQTPCPVVDDLASFMDGNACRLCKKTVHNLDGMTEGERTAFVSNCEGEVCISYTVPLRRAAAAAAVGAALMGLPAAAQDTAQSSPPETSEPAETAEFNEEYYQMQIAGGMRHTPEMVEIDTDTDTDTPVVTEDDAEPAPAPQPKAD